MYGKKIIKQILFTAIFFWGMLCLAHSAGIFNTGFPEKNRSQLYRVLKVYDGDTILVKATGQPFKIRFAGIDSPETGFDGMPGQPFSKAAKKYLSNLLMNRKITLHRYGKGGYNRVLAEVFYGNENINLKMVQAGLAEVYRGKRPENFNSELYFSAETLARKSKKGMWAQGDSYQSPRRWRKIHPRK